LCIIAQAEAEVNPSPIGNNVRLHIRRQSLLLAFPRIAYAET